MSVYFRCRAVYSYSYPYIRKYHEDQRLSRTCVLPYSKIRFPSLFHLRIASSGSKIVPLSLIALRRRE